MTYNIKALDKIEKLLYDIIFSSEDEFKISYMDYIDDMCDIEIFTSKILDNIADANISTKEQIHILTKEQKIWVLKINR